MLENAASPVVRLWRIVGSDLSDPLVAEVVRHEVRPRIDRVPGFLGGFVLLDAPGGEFLGMAAWDSLEAQAGSEVFMTSVTDGLERLASAELTESWTYDLVHGQPPLPPAGATGIEPTAARVVTFEGGTIAEPRTVRIAIDFATALIASDSGCVRTLHLVNRDARLLSVISFWTDLAQARVAEESARPLVETLPATNGARISALHAYEVLVHDPVALDPIGAYAAASPHAE